MEVVKLLIEKGSNIHVDDDYALKWSAINGHLPVVKFLIKKGADIHAKNNRALIWSAGKGHLDVVKFLVEKGANNHYLQKIDKNNSFNVQNSSFLY